MFLIAAVLWGQPSAPPLSPDERWRSLQHALRLCRARPSPVAALLLLKRLRQARLRPTSLAQLEPELTQLRAAVADHIDWKTLVLLGNVDPTPVTSRLAAFLEKWRTSQRQGRLGLAT